MAGTVVADTIQNGAGNSTAMDNAIYGSAKAWGYFSISGSSCTVLGSYNISSVTYLATGQYQANFTNALADANYSCVTNSVAGSGGFITNFYTKTTSNVNLRAYNASQVSTDATSYNFAVFR